MGLFKKEICEICAKTVSLGKLKCKDGYICMSCANTLTNNNLTSFSAIPLTSREDLNNKIQVFSSRKSNFKETARVESHISFSDITNEIYVPYNNSGDKFISYSDILDFELIEDGQTIVSKGGLGRAVAGGILFGGAGAIIGGVTGKRKSSQTVKFIKIKITIRNIKNPNIDINLLNKEVKKDSSLYKKSIDNAQEILSMLKIVISKNDNSNSEELEENKISVADELIKLKTLLEEGILTQQEFNIQKEKILT